MKLERLSVEEALRRGQALPWALMRSLGGMSLGATPKYMETEELVEARFFDAAYRSAPLSPRRRAAGRGADAGGGRQYTGKGLQDRKPPRTARA